MITAIYQSQQLWGKWEQRDFVKSGKKSAIAKLLYEDTSKEKLTNLALIEEAVRSQMLLSDLGRAIKRIYLE